LTPRVLFLNIINTAPVLFISCCAGGYRHFSAPLHSAACFVGLMKDMMAQLS